MSSSSLFDYGSISLHCDRRHNCDVPRQNILFSVLHHSVTLHCADHNGSCPVCKRIIYKTDVRMKVLTLLGFLTSLVVKGLTQGEDYEGELFDTTEAVLPPGEGHQSFIY